MAEFLRILGNKALTASYTDIYVVADLIGPDNATGPIPQAVIGSIILCETGTASANVDIRVVPKGITGGDITDIYNIFDTFAMSSNQTKIISPGITLSTGDKIEAKASTTAVNIFIFGSELT